MFETQNPDFIETVQQSFARQGLLRTIGATLTSILPGDVTIELTVTETVS